MQNTIFTTITTSKDNINNKNTLFVLIPITLFSVLLLSLSTISSPSSSSIPPPPLNPFLFPNQQTHHTLFLNTNPNHNPILKNSFIDPKKVKSLNSYPISSPSIAYFITGSSGDFNRIIRLLFAIYHPKNYYLLHLDRFAPQSERDSLAILVQSVPIFRGAQNVDVIGKADFVYLKGSSAISSTLHGASILLRLSEKWDWFINLSAKDYPLVTQDDLLHILSFLPKELNFVNHTSYIGPKELRKLKPIIVDPGLYLLEKTKLFYASQKRDLPTAYRLFTGASSSILSRSFVEFCILGSENMPRTVLMYLSNTRSSLPNYFPTVLCNSPQFNGTIVNDNLQYALLADGSSRSLSSNDFNHLIESGAAFATQFSSNESVLDRIDRDVLGRVPNEPVPGGWCLDEAKNGTCSVWGDAEILRPGSGAKRLEKRMVGLLSNGLFKSHQCIVEES